MPVQNHM